MTKTYPACTLKGSNVSIAPNGVQKHQSAITAPRLPPAPTRADTTANCLGIMKGTIPKLVDSAICTHNENITKTIRATYQGWLSSTKPNPNKKMASKSSTTNCAQSLPGKPHFRKSRSLSMPPKGLANKFMRPKLPANTAAASLSISK